MEREREPSIEIKGHKMKIEHLAIWVSDLELMRGFYADYFDATSVQKYDNDSKKFSSYFLSFDDGPRLELMQKPEIHAIENRSKEYLGISHFAVSVASKENVNTLTEKLRNNRFMVVGNARIPGDGYYESVAIDPEENRIEITI
ncbi:MAG: lactoylglutathione lyase [Maribacter sp.]|jgi:lactoylglutathione lyase